MDDLNDESPKKKIQDADINIKLEVENQLSDSAEIEKHNQKAYQEYISGASKNEDLKRQQLEFEQRLKSKREDEIKPPSLKCKKSSDGHKNVKDSNHAIGDANSSHHGSLYERLSNSSSDFHGIIGDEELAKDMGIFSFDINHKSKSHSQSVKKPSLQSNSSEFSPSNLPVRRNSLDDSEIAAKDSEKSGSKYIASLFTDKKKDNNLSGIFGGSKIRSKSGDNVKKSITSRS